MLLSRRSGLHFWPGFAHAGRDGVAGRLLLSKGSEAYLPAEVFQHLKLTEKSDLYSFGLVVWEVFYGIFWHAIHSKEKRRRQTERA